ncbi:glucan phosphoethanolaminetransferase (alkaline phosphatase superfamily) [Alkalibacillus salilacus]|uniref:Glucan phosphoethanolaminetransferase (Alkaline phosphatase superfamily) n=1 Tax=Alkalibacillus salilacus TaxID=284582 RepID=A0ABT9VIL9_9BACI|nr:glucan phosphoethanolaminetransferase (alkaline phosphatase superfamily) [Alkalibacillus salilacus]
MFTKRNSLILSIIAFVLSILVISSSPNFIATGLLVIVSVLLFCNYLRFKYALKTAELVGIFIAAIILVFSLFIIVLLAVFYFNMQ